MSTPVAAAPTTTPPPSPPAAASPFAAFAARAQELQRTDATKFYIVCLAALVLVLLLYRMLV